MDKDYRMRYMLREYNPLKNMRILTKLTNVWNWKAKEFLRWDENEMEKDSYENESNKDSNENEMEKHRYENEMEEDSYEIEKEEDSYENEIWKTHMRFGGDSN